MKNEIANVDHVLTALKLVLHSSSLFMTLLATLFVSVSYAEELPALFERHCYECHSEDLAEAGVRLDSLVADADYSGDFVRWEQVLTHLVDRSMPPRDNVDRPSQETYEVMVARLRALLSVAEHKRAESKPNSLRRLNRAEYNNTVRDLFRIEGLRPAEAFPVDDALYGFDNVAEGLTISPIHLDNYYAAAMKVLDAVLVDGERPPERSQRHTFRFYEDKLGDRQLRLRDGNSFVGKGNHDRCWIGGPLYAVLDPREAGTYRFTVSAIPWQFKKSTGGFVTTVNDRGRQFWDIEPTDGQRQTLIEFQSRLAKSREQQKVEVHWSENQHRLSEKRAGYIENESPFRKLKAVEKAAPKATPQEWLKSLDWPYFTEVEVQVTGPIHEQWPPAYTTRLLEPAKGEEQFKPILQRVLPRMFRRPVGEAELQRYVAIAEKEREIGEPFLEALKQSLATAMTSPHFLFLVESPPPRTAKGGYELTPFELASRLSYFLWSSMPDDRLSERADDGSLSDPAILVEEVKRMLLDPKARALTDGFAEQWLDTRRIPSLMPEPTLFVEHFDPYVHDAMAHEMLGFFDIVRREDLPLRTFLSADFTVVNAALARLYGIENVNGQTMRRVPLSDLNRGGLVTQAGFLALTSEATRTSPVKRGIAILEQLFHRPPPPPPPNAGTLEQTGDLSPQPVAHRLAAHRENDACAGCHNRIDPWGLALEKFNAVGAFRDREKVVPPDQIYSPHWKQKPVYFEFPAAVEFDDGREVRDIPEFKEYLLEREDDFARGFTEQLMIYALGRELLVRDQDVIDSILAETKPSGYALNKLIQQIVCSKPFRTR